MSDRKVLSKNACPKPLHGKICACSISSIDPICEALLTKSCNSKNTAKSRVKLCSATDNNSNNDIDLCLPLNDNYDRHVLEPNCTASDSDNKVMGFKLPLNDNCNGNLLCDESVESQNKR